MALDFQSLVFFVVAAGILLTIFLSLRAEKVMQSAYWLITMLVLVSILFLLANSEILFALQVSVYSGGIAVLLLFGVLLTEHDEFKFTSILKASATQVVIFIIVAFNLILYISSSVSNAAYTSTTSTLGGNVKVTDAFANTKAFANAIWGTYGVAVPLLALLLLASLLGAVKVVIREWEIEDLSDEVRARVLRTEEDLLEEEMD